MWNRIFLIFVQDMFLKMWVEVPRQLTLVLGLPKIMHLIKPLGLINPSPASRVQGEQC